MLLADVKRIPIKNNSVDVVICNSMSHHIPKEDVGIMLAEIARILKNSGKLFFLDAVLRQESFLNRFFWSLDRGEHPHTKPSLNSLIKQHFVIDHSEEFSHLYDFVFFVCAKSNIDPQK